ncbi:MAG TPA: hypothetical protein VNH83_00420, partial [Bryobacteraceae bacterium]|nr:hypothetical protein [Bryobacteraceae bacterium]
SMQVVLLRTTWACDRESQSFHGRCRGFSSNGSAEIALAETVAGSYAARYSPGVGCWSMNGDSVLANPT